MEEMKEEMKEIREMKAAMEEEMKEIREMKAAMEEMIEILENKNRAHIRTSFTEVDEEAADSIHVTSTL
jgi:type II secretory pathway component PulM